MELLNDLNLSLNTFLTNVWATGVKRNEYAEKRKSSCCINLVLHHLYVIIMTEINNDCLLRLIAAIYRMAELQSYLQNI